MVATSDVKGGKRVEVTSGQLRTLKLTVDIQKIPHTSQKRWGDHPPRPLVAPIASRAVCLCLCDGLTSKQENRLATSPLTKQTEF